MCGENDHLIGEILGYPNSQSLSSLLSSQDNKRHEQEMKDFIQVHSNFRLTLFTIQWIYEKVNLKCKLIHKN